MRASASVLSIMTFAAVSLGLQGCPPGQGPEAPVDVTGVYEGVWSGVTNGSNNPDVKQETVDQCPISFELTQDTSRGFPANLGVNGKVTIDLSCVELPERIPPPESETVNVVGAVDENGRLTLASGGCGIGLCVTLVLQGDTEDLNDDGLADRIAGEWTYSLLLPGVLPYTIAGEFAVDVVTEPVEEGEVEGEGEAS